MNNNETNNNENQEKIIPIEPQQITPLEKQTIPSENSVEKNALNNEQQEETKDVIIPITPIPGTETNNNITNTNTLETNSNNNAIETNNNPILNLDSSSPFDIGINEPMSNNNSNIDNIESQNNTEIINSTESTNQTQDIKIETTQDNNNDNKITSVGQYLLYIVLFSIPIIGLIIMIIKALDKNNKNISNFAKAWLIIYVITFVISSIIMLLFGASIINSINNSPTTNVDNYTIDYSNTSDY